MAERTVKVRLEAAVSGYQAAMARASQSTKEFGKEVTQASQKSKQSMQTLGTAFVVTGGLISAAMAMSAKSAIDFESSFAGVRKTVSGTPAQLDGIASGFRKLSREIPSSIDEINGVGEAAGQLGIATPNILGFTKTMLDLGETTNLSATEAATQLARLANITGLSQTEFDRLGSTVVALGNNFATTEAEIVGMSLRLSGAGAQVGLTEAQILSFATALSSVGIEAEAGGTAFSKVMIDIASEVANGGENLELFAEVAGMSATAFSEAFEQDAAGALVAFVSGLGDMDQAGGSTLQVLEQLGITEVRMRDALLRASGAGDLLNRTLDTGTQAWEENTALTDEAAQRYATTAAKVEIARNAINDAAITIGQTFTPAVGNAADAVAGLSSYVSGLPAPAATAVGVLGSLTGAAALTAGGFLLAAPRIVDTRKALSTLAETMPRATSGLAKVGSILTGPWGLALAGGTIALGIWAAEQAKANREIQEFVDTLDQSSGAVTDHTETLIRKTLVDRGADEQAQLLGLTMRDLTDAVLGDIDAQNKLALATDGVVESSGRATSDYALLTGQIDDEARAASSLTNTIADLQGKQNDAIDVQRRLLVAQADLEGKYFDIQHVLASGVTPEQEGFNAAVAGSITSLSGATSATEDAADAQGDYADETAAATSALQLQADIIAAQLDPFYAVVAATRDLQEAEKDLAAVHADSESTADNLSAANINLAEKAQRLRIAQAGLVDENNNLSASAEEARLRLEQLGIPPDVIDEIMVQFGTVLDGLEDVVQADNTVTVDINIQEAMRRLNTLRQSLNQVTGGRLMIPELTNQAAVRKQHAGGWAGSGPVHSGPLRNDEVPAVLQTGEYVLSRAQVSDLMAGLPTFHGGGPVGVEAPREVSLVQGVVSSALGGDSAALSAGVREVNEMMDRLERYETERRANMARDQLVDRVGAAQGAVASAETVEERAEAERDLADAVAAVAESDRDRVIADAEVVLADAEARLASELRIATNREEWEFSQMSTADQISLLTRRLQSERRFTDEWVRLSGLREQLMDREAQAAAELAAAAADAAQALASSAADQADDALAVLNRMLDERRSILAELTRLEQDHAADVAAIQADLADTIAGLQESRRRELDRGLPLDPSLGYDAATITDVLASETAALTEWADGLDALRARGVDESLIELLGLDAGPEALGQITELLAATDAELENLNAAALARERAIGDQIAAEREDQASQLSRDIAEAVAEHNAELAALQEAFVASQQELTDQLAQIGMEQGRTLTEALAEGIASGLPALEAQVEAVWALLRALDQAQSDAVAASNAADDAAAAARGFSTVAAQTFVTPVATATTSNFSVQLDGDIVVPPSWTQAQARGFVQDEIAGAFERVAGGRVAAGSRR